MTTVGYGDLYPKTFQGRLVGVVCMFSGILLIALPTAIVGQNFQEVYRDMLEQQQRTLRRRSSKNMTINTITALKKKASVARMGKGDEREQTAKSSKNPQNVSWKRIEILSDRSNSRKEKLKALQVREQRIQEELKTEIRSLVQILEAHPLRSESVT
jgi:poly-D-alanine transfer protein DltD